MAHPPPVMALQKLNPVEAYNMFNQFNGNAAPITSSSQMTSMTDAANTNGDQKEVEAEIVSVYYGNKSIMFPDNNAYESLVVSLSNSPPPEASASGIAVTLSGDKPGILRKIRPTDATIRLDSVSFAFCEV